MDRYFYADAFRSHLAEIGTFKAGYARLGKGDGSGTIIFDLSQRLVYIHNDYKETSTVKVAQEINILSLNAPGMERKRVRLGYPNYSPRELHLLGFDTGEGASSLGGVLPQEQIQQASALSQAGNLTPFRLSTTSTASKEVYVSPGAYFNASTGTWNWFFGQDTSTCEDTITERIAALTSGQHQMCLIVFDTETGDLLTLVNTAVTGTEKTDFDASTISSGYTIKPSYILCGAVYLFYGQTSVEESSTRTDFYRMIDPRVLFTQMSNLIRVSTANISNPPTASELNTALGTATNVGKGFCALVDDNGSDANVYLVASTGTSWWYASMTKAV